MTTGRLLKTGRGSVRRKQTSRAEWRKLIALAEVLGEAAQDETTRAEGGGSEAGKLTGYGDQRVRMMTFHRLSTQATVGAFEAGGVATGDLAMAFVRTARAFARPETPGELRRDIAPVMVAGARFLDQALTRLADAEFESAHRGRPEVFG